MLRAKSESIGNGAAKQEKAQVLPRKETDPFRYGVALMALVVVCLILICAYFTDRQGGDDEIGLFNPTYMDLDYGKATYPVAGFYDSMPVHPPIHYKIIAAFMRAGMTLYYAQATPTVLLLLLCVGLIVTSRFSSPVKIGFLFGLWLSYAFFSKPGTELFRHGPVGEGWVLELFGMRPEGDVGAGWLAGLLALESGRQRDWSLPKIFLGALLLTYAASLHYYATVAVLGCAVYAGCAFFELGWTRAKRVIGVITLACLIYGLSDLIFWIIPQHADILYMIRGTGARETVAAVIREHLTLYQYWASQGIGIAWMRLPFSLGLPVVLVSTPILLAIRGTKVVCLAALPLQAFLLLFAWHKHAYYFIHEIGMYGLAVVAALLTILGLALRKLSNTRLTSAISLAVVGLLAFSLCQLTTLRSGIILSTNARIHEQEIARASARAILGSQARVASRLGIWYASGAADWYNPSPKLLWASSESSEDAASYLARFDAICETRHMSDATSNSDHKALLSWYLDGTLKLRGFFFAEANSDLNYLLLQHTVTAPAQGFGLKSGELLSFQESAGGDHELIILMGPQDALLNAFSQRAIFHNSMPLPSPYGDQVLLAAIFPSARSLGDVEQIPGSRVIQRVPLTASTVDKYALVANLRRADRPIRFHQSGVPVPDDYSGGAKDNARGR